MIPGRRRHRDGIDDPQALRSVAPTETRRFTPPIGASTDLKVPR